TSMLTEGAANSPESTRCFGGVNHSMLCKKAVDNPMGCVLKLLIKPLKIEKPQQAPRFSQNKTSIVGLPLESDIAASD
ncbi:MAG: hypothetical protein KDI88_03630, partial [Gammaproteobacteria bacterium]|nr:hypothetical protein [Gammaproteobacteria bacterium]